MRTRFRSDSLPPWQERTVKQLPGGGHMEIVAPRRRAPSPARYGRQCEVSAERVLRAAGYTVTRSHLSRGDADLVAFGRLAPSVQSDARVQQYLRTLDLLSRGGFVPYPIDTLQIQVKSCQTFRPNFCNDGLVEIARLPGHCRRLVFGYVYGDGHVITIELCMDGTVRVTGVTKYADGVRASVCRMRRQVS